MLLCFLGELRLLSKLSNMNANPTPSVTPMSSAKLTFSLKFGLTGSVGATAFCHTVTVTPLALGLPSEIRSENTSPTVLTTRWALSGLESLYRTSINWVPLICSVLKL
jgi:hypothetical protein